MSSPEKTNAASSHALGVGRSSRREAWIPRSLRSSISYNRLRGTVRGLHFQRPPHEENKIVRCTRGAIFDVIVDVRPRSSTYLQWQGFELTAENRRAVYIPKGLVHGFQTLAEHCEVAYQISAFYAPEAAGGYRYDDAAFRILWPLPVTMISERDLGWPKFKVGIPPGSLYAGH